MLKFIFLLIVLIVVLGILLPSSIERQIAYNHLVPSGSPIGSSDYMITADFHDPEYFKIFHMQHTGVDIVPNSKWYIENNRQEVYIYSTIAGIGYKYYEECSGEAAIIENSQYIVYYGHVSSVLFSNSSHISYMQKIAIMGESGEKGICVTGTHVHYQIYKNIGGQFVIVNPAEYLN